MSETLQGRRLAQNSLLTLGTGLLLLAAAVVLIPFMLDAFGRELFGLLAITWIVLTHMGWLDFGLSRATAKYVARDLALGQREQAARWAWTALATQLCLGGAGALAVWFAAGPIATALDVRPETRGLAVFTLHVFALAIPLELMARSLTGVLEAAQRFVWINAYRTLAAGWTYGVYLLGILADGSFELVVWGLFALRIAGVLGLGWLAGRVVPLWRALTERLVSAADYRGSLGEMLRYGSWVTVATVIGPLLVYFDQWTIGLLLGVATLPLYSIPFSFLLRLFVFPFSLTQTLFPAFSALEARQEWDRIQTLFVRAHRYLLMTVLPLAFVIYAWAHELLRVWIDRDFADRAATPLRILVCGFAIGLLAPLSGALLEGIGRPDVVAKLYLVELPLNIALVIVLTREFGLVGAATSFAVRTVIETGLLWVFVARLLDFSRDALGLIARTGKQAALAFVLLGVAAQLTRGSQIDDPSALLVTTALLLAYAGAVALFALDDRDRTLLRSLVRREAV